MVPRVLGFTAIHVPIVHPKPIVVCQNRQYFQKVPLSFLQVVPL